LKWFGFLIGMLVGLVLSSGHVLRGAERTAFTASRPAIEDALKSASTQPARGLRLPRIFSDGMVLQRDKSVPIWGWADAGENVIVRIAGQVKATRADAAGRWSITLDPLQLGSALTMSVSGRAGAIQIRDILVGDVFQCSGQSNAAMSMDSCKRYPGTLEDIRSTNLPEVRIFQVPWGQFHATPQEDVPADCAWDSLRPERNAAYSAMAFYFARAMHQHLKIPIGIVRASHAGGMAEIKMPREALLSYDLGRKFYENAIKRPKVDGGYPSSDWNGAIAPVIRYAKRGILWYQGEHNAGSGSYGYRQTLPVLIRSWRRACGDERMPFIIVQLPAHEAKGWPMLRESQLLAFKQIDNAGFVVMIDHGEKDNIHPADKRFVGERLALEARRVIYGEAVSGCGPLYDHCSIEGSRVIVHFRNFNGGLKSRTGATLAGFVVAGEDRRFVPATAEIRGDTVVVSNRMVPNPKAVRYAWESFPSDVSLFDSRDLPASPFRTDDWSE
jgi:sialate O-acetylesterase